MSQEDDDNGLLAKWLVKRYAILNTSFKDKPFDFDQALKVLKKTFKKDDDRIVRLLLSQLRQAGWIRVDFDKEDNRKRVYMLNAPNTIFANIAQNVIINAKDGKNEDRKRTT